jgi:hypothetical protein
MKDDKILGGFELVQFPELGVEKAIAKIDTGAYSGALHATNIEEKVNADGVKELMYYPLGKKELAVSTTEYKRKSIRSSNGQLEKRFIITTTVCIKGKARKISISLSDRSSMMKEVLIGRQFLRRYHFFVDVRLGTQYRYAVKEES